MRATALAQDVWKHRRMWLSIVGNFFVHKNRFVLIMQNTRADHLFHKEFESVYSQTQLHSASCQTRSFETRLGVSARLRITI